MWEDHSVLQSISPPVEDIEESLQVDVGSLLLAEAVSPEVTGQEPMGAEAESSSAPQASPELPQIANARVRGRPPAVGLLAPLKR